MIHAYFIKKAYIYRPIYFILVAQRNGPQLLNIRKIQKFQTPIRQQCNPELLGKKTVKIRMIK